MSPEELLFAKTHEWVHVADEDGKKIATVGISAFALEQLTDLVHAELPEVGRQLAVGESFGEIESVKAVSDVYSPVAGEVVAVNTELLDSLETLTDNADDNIWLIKIKIQDESGLQQLMNYQDYQRQCAEEA